ncbi:hypothetical protein CHARACLAT_023876, partial [Characodon lateralis]|nr:hypothetical protein [Characodon lateralis]
MGQTKSGSRHLQDTFMRTTKSRHVTSPGTVEPGSHPGARPGVGTCRRAPGGRVAPHRTWPGQRETRGHPPVGPPPAGGTVKDWCQEVRISSFLPLVAHPDPAVLRMVCFTHIESSFDYMLCGHINGFQMQTPHLESTPDLLTALLMT